MGFSQHGREWLWLQMGQTEADECLKRCYIISSMELSYHDGDMKKYRSWEKLIDLLI